MSSRQRAEERLLAAEKHKSEQSVDLGQLTSQCESLRKDLQLECEKSKALHERLNVEEKKRSQLQNEAKNSSQLLSQLKANAQAA